MSHHSEQLPGIRSDLALVTAIGRVRLKRVWRFSAPTTGNNRGDGLVRGVVVIPALALLFLGTTLVTAMGFGRADSAESANALLLSMVVVAFATVIAGCLTSTLQSLYLSDDVKFLVSLPIPVRLIFFAKFPDFAMGAIPGTLFLFAVCLGYVLGRATDLTFVLLAAPGAVTLSGIAIFLSAIITTAVIRYGPRRQTRAALVLISLAVLMATSLIWQRIGALPAGSSGAAEPESWPVLRLLPPGWATTFLVGISREEALAALPYLGLLAGALMLMAAAGARLFSITYTRNLEHTDLGQVSSTPRQPPKSARMLLRLVPHALLHWVKREWILVGRDFSRLSAALWPMAGAGLYALIALYRGSGSDGERFWLTHGPLLLIPWGISMGTSVFSIGAEGPSLGLIRSMPVRPRVLMLGKYFAYLIPIASLSLSVAVIAVALVPGTPRDNYLLLLLIVVLTAVFCAIDVGVAATAPRFGAEHMQRSTTFTARAIALITGLAAAISIMLGLAMSPFGWESIGAEFLGSNPTPGPVVWVGLVVVGLLLPAVTMRFGITRMSRLLSEG